MGRLIKKQKDSILIEFGQRIQARRELKGLVQMDIAIGIDADPSYVSKLENGQHEPGIITLIKLCVVLDCDPKDILPTIR